MGKISDALKKVAQLREGQIPDDPESFFDPVVEEETLPPKVSEKEPAKIKPLTLTEKLGLKEKLFVVGEKDSSGIDPRIVNYYDHSSLISEQYRTLRTTIKTTLNKIKTSEKKDINKPNFYTYVFTITSALHSEGKTLTATNLAAALAYDFGNKVLLVDCDLRKGSVHRLFNVDSKVGLSDVLGKDVDLSKAIIPTKINNLFVVPSGRSPFNPSELLGSKKMKMVLERLKREKFTHIILDTPPLLPFADGAILGAQTQGTFLVVQANRTQAPVIEKAKASLKQAQSKLLGLILTQVDSYAFSAYNYNYYYYYAKDKEESLA